MIAEDWGRRWSFPSLSNNEGPFTRALWSWMSGGAYTCELKCQSCWLPVTCVKVSEVPFGRFDNSTEKYRIKAKKKKSTLNTSRSLPIWAGEIGELPEQSDRPEGPQGIWSPTRTQCVCITPSAASGSRISDLVILLFLGACANRQIWTNSRDSLALRCAGGV